MKSQSDEQNTKDELLCALFEVAWAKYQVEKEFRTTDMIKAWVRDEMEEVFAAGDNYDEQQKETGDVLCMSILTYLWEKKYETSDGAKQALLSIIHSESLKGDETQSNIQIGIRILPPDILIEVVEKFTQRNQFLMDRDWLNFWGTSPNSVRSAELGLIMGHLSQKHPIGDINRDPIRRILRDRNCVINPENYFTELFSPVLQYNSDLHRKLIAGIPLLTQKDMDFANTLFATAFISYRSVIIRTVLRASLSTYPAGMVAECIRVLLGQDFSDYTGTALTLEPSLPISPSSHVGRCMTEEELRHRFSLDKN